MDADELLARQLQVRTCFFPPSNALKQGDASRVLEIDVISSPKLLLQAEEDRNVAQMRQMKGTGGEQAFQARLQASLHGVRQVVALYHTAANIYGMGCFHLVITHTALQDTM